MSFRELLEKKFDFTKLIKAFRTDGIILKPAGFGPGPLGSLVFRYDKNDYFAEYDKAEKIMKKFDIQYNIRQAKSDNLMYIEFA